MKRASLLTGQESLFPGIFPASIHFPSGVSLHYTVETENNPTASNHGM